MTHHGESSSKGRARLLCCTVGALTAITQECKLVAVAVGSSPTSPLIFLKGVKMSRVCKECGIKISHKSKTGYCRAHFTIPLKQEKVRLWLESGKLPIGPNSAPRHYVREYLYNDQNNCCATCGISNSWNDKELIFVLDHIDGDASNNERKNLRLVCPNCDSQLPTFKSKNKNSARTYDKEYRKSNTKKATHE